MATPIDVGDAGAGRAVVCGGRLAWCCVIFRPAKSSPPLNSTTRMAPATIRKGGERRRDRFGAAVTLNRLAASAENLTSGPAFPDLGPSANTFRPSVPSLDCERLRYRMTCS